MNRNFLSNPGVEYYYKGEQKSGVGPGFYVKDIEYDEGDMVVFLGRKTIITEFICTLVIIFSIGLFVFTEHNEFKISYDDVILLDKDKRTLFVNIVAENSDNIPYIVKFIRDDGDVTVEELDNNNPITDIPVGLREEGIEVRIYLKYLPIYPIIRYTPTIKQIG